MAEGVVYIVGAGCGDELLTKKAEEAIRKADVIIHDELIGEGIKELVRKSGAEVIDAGKRAGRHKLTQDEINELLAKYAREGKTVVRLKAGDPCIFGRGGEEAEFLADRGIKFEIVPGVSSAIAAPAYAAIPITHRRYDPAVVFITGRQARERLNWEALAKLNATIIILMGVSTLRQTAKKLMEHGKDPSTPAAIIERGCSEEQRVVVGRLEDIADIAEKEGVKAPAIIVIGGVVELREKLLPYMGVIP
ncbi:uroporphyrinogen-III C-methyltransferase [Archaeoglobus veneficus]|uniref:uroporphyrinogen-III C-methyltransferase n=1 Tax=Archaeoglobus veneficus (strain DSM 11195 / SNP6) TaxID=693661 RepID=F2KQA0_ARCVS|nr:uroporphyrinogen-III C-methyltransferase [Archaeoglobus veneficus]AEA46533.1 uroporphyrin-III C-methyltransferase [Archaeoglobus veneficus SNP6]